MSEVDTRMVSNIDNVIAKIAKTKYEKLLAASEFARNRLIEKLSGARSGRSYLVPGTNTYYTASAPGEAPASRTGQLRGSIEYQITKSSSYIGTPLEYGLELEKGVKAAPRPWLEVTISDNQAAIKNILGSRWF